MAALERYFLAKGKRIAAYDRVSTELTRMLEDEGVEFFYDDNPDLIPAYCLDKDRTLVVYTAAMPQDHKLLVFFREKGFDVVKRAKLLGIVTEHSKGLCFAGTHGKTTTSSMTAHILQVAGVGSNAFLGGELRNYNSNFLLSDTSPFSVIEADEFDRSFHTLSPYIALITSTDADHLDIYGNYENYLEGFAHFTELIKPGGMLVMHTGLDLKPRVDKSVRIYTYSREEGDFHAANIRKGNGEITFDFVSPQGVVKDINLGVPVDINIENAVAAMAVCTLAGISGEAMREAMRTFMGAKRRFEFWLKEPLPSGKVVIDDYAHHPQEIKASIKSVRELYEGRKVTVIFQPHLYTRTRDFADEFADALSEADELILLPIYPARELPIEGVSSEMLLERAKCATKTLCNKEYLLKSLHLFNFEVLLVLGAGDVIDLLPQICEEVKKQAR